MNKQEQKAYDVLRRELVSLSRLLTGWNDTSKIADLSHDAGVAIRIANRIMTDLAKVRAVAAQRMVKGSAVGRT